MQAHGNSPQKVVVVGGGYSAASFAVQLVRRTRTALEISIVEPREEVGRGLAYSATDPDHRLNAPLEPHSIDPDAPSEVREWCARNGVLEDDPGCYAPGGQVFLRRGDFGRHVNDMVQRHASHEPSGSTIKHVRDIAVSATVDDGGCFVETQRHGRIPADLIVVATGNPVPALRPPFDPGHARCPGIIGNPLERGCLDRIPTGARVLVVGGGLTALDILSTLVRRGHRGEVLAISRRGMRPRSHAPDVLQPGSLGLDVTPVQLDLDVPVPAFIDSAPPTARGWVRALRREIAKDRDAGRSWHAAFDAVRNAVWKIWPTLAVQEKRRFLRRLGLFYDVHRFRMPPMNESLVRAAEQQGLVRHAAVRLVRVDPAPRGGTIDVEMIEVGSGRKVHDRFDFIVNCTGLDHAAATRSNPFLRSLLEQGVLRPHTTGLGFDVGPNCEALDFKGNPQPGLRVIGPPTAGAFGDPLGAVFIAAQVKRMLHDVMLHLEAKHASSLHPGDRQ